MSPVWCSEDELEDVVFLSAVEWGRVIGCRK